MNIRGATLADADWLQDSFDRLMGWQKPKGYFADCCRQQAEKRIVLLVAESNGDYIGHIKVVWQSSYAYFRVLASPRSRI